jgi:hypothetical protein
MSGGDHNPIRNMIRSVEVAPNQYGTGSTNGNGVDMLGWDGVEFEAILGGLVATATFDLRVLGSANSNFSGAVNITNAAIVQSLAADGNNRVVSVAVHRPTNRYIRVNATVGTANVFYGVSAYRYRGQSRLPATLPTNHQFVAVAEN